MTSRPTPTEQWKAWFGCIIDGEGTIKGRYTCGRNNLTWSPRIRIIVGNNAAFILELLKTFYGGCIVNRGGRRCKSWELNNDEDIVHFLTDIKPYVLIKRQLLYLALGFFDVNPGPDGRNKEAGEIRRRIVDVMYHLNQKEVDEWENFELSRLIQVVSGQDLLSPMTCESILTAFSWVKNRSEQLATIQEQQNE